MGGQLLKKRCIRKNYSLQSNFSDECSVTSAPYSDQTVKLSYFLPTSLPIKSELIQSQINQKILGYFFFQYTVGSIANGLGFNLTIFRPLVLSNHLFNPVI